MKPRGTAGLAALDAPDFNLDLTLGCGQVFHWIKRGNGYLGSIGNRPMYVERQGTTLYVPRGSEELAARYFALDHPLPEIYSTFPKDPAMREALEHCRGMRLIRQPPWECVATFITSSMKQVAHIAQISHTLRRRFGNRVEWNGDELFVYPEPERLARLDEADLRACSLGYRAKTLLGAARLIEEGGVDLEAIRTLDDAEALRRLCLLPGVGVKVANCALLFAYERERAFPIDVWIERILREIYFADRPNATARQLKEFSASYFGPYGGYAQQYLFHRARKTWKRPKRPPTIEARAKISRRSKESI